MVASAHSGGEACNGILVAEYNPELALAPLQCSL